jgi:hypothetical protein
MMSSKAHKFTGPLEHRVAIGGTSAHGDATPSSEFNQPFFSQRSQRPEHGVVVDTQYRGEVACCWESVSRFSLSIPDCTPNLRCDLLMERCPICRIDPRGQHGANETSLIGPNCPGGSGRAAVAAAPLPCPLCWRCFAPGTRRCPARREAVPPSGTSGVVLAEWAMST